MGRPKKLKDAEEGAEQPVLETDPAKLASSFIREFNKGNKEKLAWCLATDADNPTDVKEFISTGSTLLDYSVSNRRDGGVPVGKLTELSGEEASGKSLVCAHLIANCQKRGGIAFYIDNENAMNPEFARQIGVDLRKLVYMQVPTVEMVGETVEKIILTARQKAPDSLILIVWDSVRSTPCKAELEGEYENDMNAALMKAKALSKMMLKLVQTWGKERIAMVVTNHLTTKIGVMYGDPMQTPGGKAIPYYSSVRIRLNRSTQVKAGVLQKDEAAAAAEAESDKGDVVGIHTIAKVVKCRLGPPLRRCEFDIMFADGIDDEKSWFYYLHQKGEVEKHEGWCYLNGFPSGKEAEYTKGGKRVTADRGVSFREKGWKELLRARPDVKEWVLDMIEYYGVIKYEKQDELVDDAVADPESLMDAEAVVDALAPKIGTPAPLGG